MSDASAQSGGDSAEVASADPREVLAAAYDAHAEGMFRHAVMILGDAAAAEDAVQQAFVKLLRMGRRVLAIESLEAYVRTAVRHECYRHVTRRRETSVARVGPLLEAVSPEWIDDEERLLLESALQSLPPEQREVVHLKVYEQCTFRRIGEIQGVSTHTAASRYRYAIEKLRGLLGPRIEEAQ